MSLSHRVAEWSKGKGWVYHCFATDTNFGNDKNAIHCLCVVNLP